MPGQAGWFLKKKKIEEYCLKPRQAGRFLKKKKELRVLFEILPLRFEREWKCYHWNR